METNHQRCQHLVLSEDSPTKSRRSCCQRTRFSLPPSARPGSAQHCPNHVSPRPISVSRCCRDKVPQMVAGKKTKKEKQNRELLIHSSGDRSPDMGLEPLNPRRGQGWLLEAPRGGRAAVPFPASGGATAPLAAGPARPQPLGRWAPLLLGLWPSGRALPCDCRRPTCLGPKEPRLLIS